MYFLLDQVNFNKCYKVVWNFRWLLKRDHRGYWHKSQLEKRKFVASCNENGVALVDCFTAPSFFSQQLQATSFYKTKDSWPEHHVWNMYYLLSLKITTANVKWSRGPFKGRTGKTQCLPIAVAGRDHMCMCMCKYSFSVGPLWLLIFIWFHSNTAEHHQGCICFSSLYVSAVGFQ